MPDPVQFAGDGIAAQSAAQLGGNERERQPFGMQLLELLHSLSIPEVVVRIGHRV